MMSYKPGDRIMVRVDNNGNCTEDVTNSKYVEVQILAICGPDKEYLVHIDNSIENTIASDAIICAKDWEDPSLKNYYQIHPEIKNYDGMSGAWIRPRFVLNKRTKTGRSGEYQMNFQ